MWIPPSDIIIKRFFLVFFKFYILILMSFVYTFQKPLSNFFFAEKFVFRFLFEFNFITL